MAKRGTPTTIPKWWLQEIDRELEVRQWDDADLAAGIVGGRDAKSFSAMQTKLSRFFERGKARKPIHTIETAAMIAKVLKLPPYEFRPASRAQAEKVLATLAEQAEQIMAEGILHQGLALALARRPDITVQEAQRLSELLEREMGSPQSGDHGDRGKR